MSKITILHGPNNEHISMFKDMDELIGLAVKERNFVYRVCEGPKLAEELESYNYPEKTINFVLNKPAVVETGYDGEYNYYSIEEVPSKITMAIKCLFGKKCTILEFDDVENKDE